MFYNCKEGNDTMNRIGLLAGVCTLAATSLVFAAVNPPEWFKPLFNGKDLTGWKQNASVREHWKVVDGVLTYDGKGTSLVTQKNYRNFILTLRWKIEKGGDSGIYLRGKPQVQIWDNPIGSGGLHNDGINPSKNVDRPLGQWNHFVIILRGNKVTVVENGIQVVDRAEMNSIGGLPEEGPIELQHHHSPLWFKDIYIRELPD